MSETPDPVLGPGKEVKRGTPLTMGNINVLINVSGMYIHYKLTSF